MEDKSQLGIIKAEIERELATAEARNQLMQTVFKGLPEGVMKTAIFEGMVRGFTFKNFLEKDVYAIPFKNKTGIVGYSLVTSIDRARKIAMASGLAGKSAPTYKYTENKDIESCSVTVKRSVDGVIGEYTATVFFKEYYKPGFGTMKTLWDTKPHTMIAKVAEMHALRSAFPEKMAKDYIEEEMERDIEITAPAETLTEEQRRELEKKLNDTKSLEELRSVFAQFSPLAKKELRPLADLLKGNYENTEL